MSKKKVTAPLSYDPGKGRPKEFLAYLNWQEMQALQRLNGGNMEFGPRGLPSFPPADAVGSGQTPGTGNWTGAPGGTSVGSGSGGDVGSRTESGNISGGTAQTSTAASTSTSASTTSAASQNTTDTAAQQTAAINDAANAARNSALAEDAKKSGINSINVGPMQTPVKIGSGAISQAVLSATVPTSAISGFMTPQQQMADRLNTMYSPNALGSLYKGIGTYGISDPEKRSRIQESLLGQTIELSKTGKTLGYKAAPNVKFSGYTNPLESDVVMHWTGSPTTKIPALGVGKGYGYGVVVDPSGNVSYTKPFNQEGNFPQTWHTSGYNTGRIGIASVGIEPNPAQVAAAKALGREWFNPEAQVTSHGYVAGDIAEQRKAAGQKFSGRPSREGKALASAFSGGLGDLNQPAYSSPSSPSQTIPSGGSVVPASIELTEVERIYNPSVVPSTPSKVGKLYQERLIDINGVTTEVGPEKFAAMDPADRARIDAYQQAQVYTPGPSTPSAPVTTTTVTPTEEQQVVDVPNERTDFVLREDEQNYPKYVSPERQALIADQEKKNRIGVKVIERAPFVGGIASIGEGLTRLFTGEDIADRSTKMKYAFEQMSPEQQAEAMRKYPDMRRYAVSAGIIPPSTGSQYASSGTPERELGGKNYDQLYASYKPQYSPQYQYSPDRVATMDNSLARKYRRWDKGIGIPSPGDPDYNEYRDYIRLKGSSAEV